MTEPAATGGVVNPEIALRREVDTLAQRFPDVDRAEGQVTDDLRKRGETVHVRGEDVG